MSATPNLVVSLLTYAGVLIVSAVVLYFVVRGAIVSALRHHALWRGDGSFDVELQRHRRDAES